MNDLRTSYFNWIISWLMPDEAKRQDYIILLSSLFKKEFTYDMPMDDNRYQDGLELRYLFGNSYGIPQYVISNELDIYKCSVLEMMAALVLRCDKTLFNGPVQRCDVWFWEMIKSLEMEEMSDYIFDDEEFEYKVNKLLTRTYNYNGRGGLFTLANPIKDMRTADIWYQAMWWFDIVLKKEGILV